MKRILLFGMILAICILAMPQGVLATVITPGGVVVDAKYAGSALTFTADKYVTGHTGVQASSPPAFPTWPWALSENAAAATAPFNLQANALHFTVDSTLNWDVSASGTDNGYMRSTAAKPLLDNPFQIKNEGGSWVATPNNGAAIEDGVPADTEFWKDIDQKVVQADYSAGAYSITETFTCTNLWTT